MTTDRKIFIFTPRRGIMAEIEYPGVVQLIERVVWDHEAASLSLATRTKSPLKSLISEGFSYSLSIAAQGVRGGCHGNILWEILEINVIMNLFNGRF